MVVTLPAEVPALWRLSLGWMRSPVGGERAVPQAAFVAWLAREARSKMSS